MSKSKGFLKELARGSNPVVSIPVFDWRQKASGKKNAPNRSHGALKIDAEGVGENKDKLADSSVPFHKRKEIIDAT